MSRSRFIAGLLTAVISGAAVPSQAQQVVIDPTAIGHMLTEFAQLLKQYQVLMCSLQTAQATTNSLQHLNSGIMGIAPGLQSSQMRLPGSAASVLPGLNFGSSLSGAGQTAYNQNHVYTSTGTDFAATELQRRQMATANLQGEAATGMQQIEARVTSLMQLETAISNQPDVHAMAALNGRIAAEKTYIDNERNKIANLQLMAQTQQLVNNQRAEQDNRQMFDQAESNAASLAGWR